MCLITNAIIVPLKQVHFPAIKSWELLNRKGLLLDMLENLVPNKNAEAGILQSYLISICGLNIFQYLMNACYMKAFFLRTPYFHLQKATEQKLFSRITYSGVVFQALSVCTCIRIFT